MKQAVTAFVRSRGRITLPCELCRHLALKQGDKVQFDVQLDGAVLVSACPQPSSAVTPVKADSSAVWKAWRGKR